MMNIPVLSAYLYCFFFVAASKERNDDVCLCNLLQGICLRYLGEIKKAEKVFNEVAARYRGIIFYFFPLTLHFISINLLIVFL